jgi:transcriptional regulator with XRE-family HTH domain
MTIEESTARSREIGAELRRVREKARLSGHALARLLGWPAPKISRLETGKREVSEVDVAIFLARCGAPPDELERLMELARLTDAGYRSQVHGRKLPDELRSLIVLETNAEAIFGYEPLVVPGLLQTETYIRELLRLGGRKPGPGFEQRVEARLARQAIWNRRWPPELSFFVHEHALRSMVGGLPVMREQLLHLVLATSWPRCKIRVIPDSTALVSVLGGAFRLMSFRDEHPVAYVEGHTASMFLDGEEHIQNYRELLDGLVGVALNGGESREWLAALASEYDRVETVRDDRAGPARISLA